MGPGQELCSLWKIDVKHQWSEGTVGAPIQRRLFGVLSYLLSPAAHLCTRSISAQINIDLAVFDHLSVKTGEVSEDVASPGSDEGQDKALEGKPTHIPSYASSYY